MKKSKPIFYAILLGVLFSAASGYLGYTIYHQTKKHQTEMNRYSEKLNYKNRLLNWKEWLKGELEAAPMRREATRLKRQANATKASTLKNALYYALAAILYLSLTYLIYRNTTQFHASFSLALLFISTSCLTIGILTPMMDTAAYASNLTIPIGEVYGIKSDKIFYGEIYFSYLRKSIGELIIHLIHLGNYVVAIAIALFSILMPLTKITMSFICLFTKAQPDSRKVKIIKSVGKWSMADVFVIAILLSYLSINSISTSGITVKSTTMVGLYFFLGYCIISLISGSFLLRALKQNVKNNSI